MTHDVPLLTVLVMGEFPLTAPLLQKADLQRRHSYFVANQARQYGTASVCMVASVPRSSTSPVPIQAYELVVKNGGYKQHSIILPSLSSLSLSASAKNSFFKRVDLISLVRKILIFRP